LDIAQRAQRGGFCRVGARAHGSTYPMAAGEQFLDEIEADMPVGAGDQDLHGPLPARSIEPMVCRCGAPATGLSAAKGMAGGLGFEPRLTESESAVLPLNYPPMRRERR